jgi:fructokinase
MNISPIIAIGEFLVDWVCPEPELKEHKIYDFKMAAGGAPANVAIGLAKLGYPGYFAGGIAKDTFGDWLFDYLQSSGVGTALVRRISKAETRHVYIFTTETGNRVMKHITITNAPDTLYTAALLGAESLAPASVIYFGSVTQSTPEGAQNVADILAMAPADALTVYDPTIRISLWTSQEDRLTQCLTQSAHLVDLLKLSDNELAFFTDEPDIQAASRIIFDRYQPALLVVTLGEKGALYISPEGEGFIQSFQVPSVEMTGAGDGFVAGLLGGLYDLALSKKQSVKDTVLTLTPMETETILRAANAVGALATMQPGATAGLPTREQLNTFLMRQQPPVLTPSFL